MATIDPTHLTDRLDTLQEELIASGCQSIAINVELFVQKLNNITDDGLAFDVDPFDCMTLTDTDMADIEQDGCACVGNVTVNVIENIVHELSKSSEAFAVDLIDVRIAVENDIDKCIDDNQLMIDDAIEAIEECIELLVADRDRSFWDEL